MLVLLTALSLSWSDELLAIAAEIGFSDLKDSEKKKLLNTFNYAGDSLENIHDAAAWTYFVERPPYNIHSFNHWHFQRNPVGFTPAQEKIHSNDDDLASVFKDLDRNLIASNMKRPWPFTFSLKVMLSVLCDIHTPLHWTELFSDQFPDGDMSGKNYAVKYNGKNTNLFDLWETGCGGYTGQWPFSDHKSLANKANTLKKSHHETAEWNTTALSQRAISTVMDEVYAGIQPGATVSDEYIKKCRATVEARVVKAGVTISAYLKRIVLPAFDITSYSVRRTSVSETTAWTLFFFLLPITCLLAWNRYCTYKLRF